MPLILPKQTEFVSVPAGSYSAVCYRVVDLGTQFSQFYQKASHKLVISWELDEKMTDGKPFSIHKRYTLSGGKNSALRKDLESWRGQAFTAEEFGTFDIGVLIGKGCMIGVSTRTTEGHTYSDVSSIMKLPKGTTPITAVNETLYFSLNDFKQDVFDKLSDHIKESIAKSPEYQQIKAPNVPDRDPSEDRYEERIPF